MDLSIVIVSWNVRELLHECLTSIYEHAEGISFEVFVVDNDSKDGTVDMVGGNFPQVNLIANDYNAGFPMGNNQALVRARGRYVLALNPDTRINSNALAEMVNFMDRNLDAGAMGPRLLNTDGTLQRSCRSFPDLETALAEHLPLQLLWPNHRIIYKYRMSDWDHLTPREVDQPMGACLMVRATAMEQIGMMDETFFIYFDEVDWCYRIKQANWKIYFDPSIEVTHHGGQSFSQWAEPKNAAAFYRGMLKFFKKHYGWSASLVLRILVLFAFGLRVTRLSLAYLVFRRDWETKKAKLRKFTTIMGVALRGV